jgi:peptide/nickel transport system permease protein
MLSIILARLLQGIAVLLVVALLGFTLTTFSDPVAGIAGPNAPDAVRDRLRIELQLDDPFLVRYARFASAALLGNFGRSYAASRPVSDMIAERLPATVELGLVATALSLAIGIPLGIYTAINRHGFVASILLTVSLVGMSLPNFVLGIVLIFVFSVILGWLPSFGRGDVVAIGGWSTGLLSIAGLKSLIMPSLALAIPQSTLVLRLVRAEMLEVMRTDFIRFARARGLPPRVVNLRHALRNAWLPVITITGLQVGSLLSFAIVVEAVFQWPGLGLLFLQAIQQSDIPVVAAMLLLVGFFFVVVNLVVDLLYIAVDPRLRYGLGSAR